MTSKPTKRMLTRPSPPMSAAEVPGQLRKGNDESMWRSSQCGSVYRWKPSAASVTKKLYMNPKVPMTKQGSEMCRSCRMCNGSCPACRECAREMKSKMKARNTLQGKTMVNKVRRSLGRPTKSWGQPKATMNMNAGDRQQYAAFTSKMKRERMHEVRRIGEARGGQREKEAKQIRQRVKARNEYRRMYDAL